VAATDPPSAGEELDMTASHTKDRPPPREDCDICRRVVFGDPALTVGETSEWKVFLNEQFTSRPLVWVAARQHVEGLWALTDAQASTWAVVLRETAAAMRTAFAGERVYVAHFGESHPHFHAVMLARSTGAAEPGPRGVSLLATVLASKSTADVVTAARSAAALREQALPFVS
jgi:diadenosine tetraphosphate (Ap4A) HIT family hydrolase